MTVRTTKDLGPLHRLLLEACPPNEDGDRSITILAKALGMSSWGIFKWIRNGRIPPRQAANVVDVSQGKVTLHQFDPFIYL